MTRWPSVTVVIPTYGRTRCLAEAVYSAFNQTYHGKGHIEVIVLNDYHRQTIAFNHPHVHVYNLPEKIPTLADKRQTLLSMVSTDWVAFLDDDDVLMPKHLAQIDDEAVMVMPKTYLVMDDMGGITIDPVPGGLSFMMRTKEARSVGFTSGLDVGEDNAFRNAAKEQYPHYILTPPGPTYLWRRYLRGVGHISHMVKQDASPDMARFMDAADERIDNGIEPSGKIRLDLRSDAVLDVVHRFPELALP